jgi:hypothetical protein
MDSNNQNGGGTEASAAANAVVDNSPLYLFIASSQTFSSDEAQSSLNQISSGTKYF